MADKATLSVPPSPHMQELLNDGTLCKNVSVFGWDIQRILFQIQLDVASAENRDTVGPTILALKHIQDILLLFKAKGDLLINQENKADAKAKQ